MDDAPQYAFCRDGLRKAESGGWSRSRRGRAEVSQSQSPWWRGRHPGWEEMEIRHKGDGTYHCATSLANFPTILLCLLSPMHPNFGGVERARGDGSITTLINNLMNRRYAVNRPCPCRQPLTYTE